jgi:hypothetical protein
MVVGDFDFMGISIPPNETDSPLVVDANAVLAGAAASQGFEPISGQGCEVLQRAGGVQHAKFPQGAALDGLPSPARFPPVQALGIRIAKRQDHL